MKGREIMWREWVCQCHAEATHARCLQISEYPWTLEPRKQTIEVWAIILSCARSLWCANGSELGSGTMKSKSKMRAWLMTAMSGSSSATLCRKEKNDDIFHDSCLKHVIQFYDEERLHENESHIENNVTRTDKCLTQHKRRQNFIQIAKFGEARGRKNVS